MKKVGPPTGVLKPAVKLATAQSARAERSSPAQAGSVADQLQDVSEAKSAAHAHLFTPPAASSVNSAGSALGAHSPFAARFDSATRLPKDPIRVMSPGRESASFDRLSSLDAVPRKYRSDPRFTELSSDPAHDGAQTATALREAMSGLEAERMGFMEPPITRGPAEIEFYDASGHAYDVKTPLSPPADAAWSFNARKAARSVVKQLGKSHENPATKQLAPVRVILDSTYLSRLDHAQMWQALESQLDSAQLRRIIEINVEVL